MLEATAYGHCLQWDWGLIIPWIVSDIIIALSYFAIPASIIKYMMKRHIRIEPVCRRVLVGLAALIALDGLSHVVSIFGIWFPIYQVALWIRVATAGVGFVTAIMMIPVVTLYTPLIRMMDTGKIDSAKLLDFMIYNRSVGDLGVKGDAPRT
jgi:hypothetical protein